LNDERCCDWLSAQSRSGVVIRQAQAKNSSAGSKARTNDPLKERGCVEDQPQQRGQPEDLSNKSSPVNDERCCDWLSAQSRSGVAVHRGIFSSACSCGEFAGKLVVS
jgi:hypothetical protein